MSMGKLLAQVQAYERYRSRVPRPSSSRCRRVAGARPLARVRTTSIGGNSTRAPWVAGAPVRPAKGGDDRGTWQSPPRASTLRGVARSGSVCGVANLEWVSAVLELDGP